MTRVTLEQLNERQLVTTATFPRMRLTDTKPLIPLSDYNFVADGVIPGSILRFMVGPWPGYIRVFAAGNIVYYKNEDMFRPLFVASPAVQTAFEQHQEREDFVDILFSDPLHSMLRYALDADHSWKD